jgi:hypothetical protein
MNRERELRAFGFENANHPVDIVLDRDRQPFVPCPEFIGVFDVPTHCVMYSIDGISSRAGASCAPTGETVMTKSNFERRTEKYFAKRAARANVPKALAILKRAGVGNPPMKGDAVPRRRVRDERP